MVLAVLALVCAERKEKEALMSMSVIGLSIDCADAAGLARFWSEDSAARSTLAPTPSTLRWTPQTRFAAPGFPSRRSPSPRPSRTASTWICTDQFEAESERLTGLGATPIRSFERPQIRWTTFADPEGNEFDLVAAQPSASGPRE